MRLAFGSFQRAERVWLRAIAATAAGMLLFVHVRVDPLFDLGHGVSLVAVGITDDEVVPVFGVHASLRKRPSSGNTRKT
jgi:hypothetical protein